jgi:hypothetical protein
VADERGGGSTTPRIVTLNVPPMYCFDEAAFLILSDLPGGTTSRKTAGVGPLYRESHVHPLSQNENHCRLRQYARVSVGPDLGHPRLLGIAGRPAPK